MASMYGQRLFIQALHSEARKDPERVFAIHARSNNVEDGFDHVTFRQVAAATNYLSRWLQDRFENGSEPFQIPTLTYVGIPDIRYNMLFYAAMQCRYKVFLPSPRNTVGVNMSLLQQTECARLVHSTELTALAKAFQGAMKTKLQCEELPSLGELLKVPEVEYTYDFTFQGIRDEPVLILHSSGSTREPVPVTSTHGTFASCDVRDYPTVSDRLNHEFNSSFDFLKPGSAIYDPFPPFHLAGFTSKVIGPIWREMIPIFGPSMRPPSGPLTAQIIRQLEPQGLYLPPSILEQLYYEPDGESLLSQLKFVMFAGGPLSPAVGLKITNLTVLCQMYGSTETWQTRQLLPSPEDWAYMEFHPNERLELQPSGEDETYELVLYPGPNLTQTSALYHNLPHTNVWRTKDLFKPHPKKQNLWRFHSRTDDILVFSSGQKVNPLPFETALQSSAGVKGALIVGQGYAQSALLVEMAGDATQEIWPSIEKANMLLPHYGRITRSMIVTASPEKPFPRAAKGTVIRRLTEKAYEREIAQLFASQSTSRNLSTESITLKPSVFHKRDVDSLVRQVLGRASFDTQIDQHADLYAHGLDSIKAAEILGQLQLALGPYKTRSQLSWLTMETTYLCSTVDRLNSILLSFLNDDQMPSMKDRGGSIQETIANAIDSLQRSLPILQKETKAHSANYEIAITGTTGFLGRHLLTRLASHPLISRIYCLNRSSVAEKEFEKLGVRPTAELVFLQADLAARQLGLSDEIYTRLLSSCDIILHNAWTVNFNMPLNSFDSHIRGVQEIVKLSALAAKRPRIVFVSTIGSTGVWGLAGSSQMTVPEDSVDPLKLSEGMNIGYTASKCVTETILADTASRLSIPTTILRVCHLVTGSDGTPWPKNDVVSVFLRTSKALGMIANDYLKGINWMSVDLAADIITDVLQAVFSVAVTQPTLEIFNVVNPNTSKWDTTIESLAAWCGERTRAVTLKEWVAALHKLDIHDPTVIAKYPALQILRVFEQAATRGPLHEYDVTKLSATSRSMQDMAVSDGDFAKSWLNQCK